MILNLLKSPIFYAITAGLAALLVLCTHGKGNSAAAPFQPGGAPRVVLVELFTSEGCSSCPPADALLKKLSEQQPVEGVQIVALEEHVDYWNNLGWADPYSSNEYSQRQSDYAQVFGNDGVYTPQMVVDGRKEFVGSHGTEAREAIQKAASLPKAEVALTAGANFSSDMRVLEIQIKNLSEVSLHDTAELWVAVTEKDLQTDVKAGENSGETLKHAAVVRSLRKVDSLRDSAVYKGQTQLSLDPKWKKENLTAVVFVAEKRSRKIIGVATTALNVTPASH
ncbi:MAG TPA: DUF1223 domain-containing protein [Candidatus Acidoferrum sp.]|nr:DUF1223 domain-containing protein [Candidatus Acidoferrum sp.]